MFYNALDDFGPYLPYWNWMTIDFCPHCNLPTVIKDILEKFKRSMSIQFSNVQPFCSPNIQFQCKAIPYYALHPYKTCMLYRHNVLYTNCMSIEQSIFCRHFSIFNHLWEPNRIIYMCFLFPYLQSLSLLHRIYLGNGDRQQHRQSSNWTSNMYTRHATNSLMNWCTIENEKQK